MMYLELLLSLLSVPAANQQLSLGLGPHHASWNVVLCLCFYHCQVICISMHSASYFLRYWHLKFTDGAENLKVEEIVFLLFEGN